MLTTPPMFKHIIFVIFFLLFHFYFCDFQPGVVQAATTVPQIREIIWRATVAKSARPLFAMPKNELYTGSIPAGGGGVATHAGNSD